MIPQIEEINVSSLSIIDELNKIKLYLTKLLAGV